MFLYCSHARILLESATDEGGTFMDKTRVSEAVPNALAGLVRVIDDMDRRYFVLALELRRRGGMGFPARRHQARRGHVGEARRRRYVLRLRGRAA